MLMKCKKPRNPYLLRFPTLAPDQRGLASFGDLLR